MARLSVSAWHQHRSWANLHAHDALRAFGGVWSPALAKFRRLILYASDLSHDTLVIRGLVINLYGRLWLGRARQSSSLRVGAASADTGCGLRVEKARRSRAASADTRYAARGCGLRVGKTRRSRAASADTRQAARGSRQTVDAHQRRIMLLSQHGARRVAQVATDGLLQKAKVFLGDRRSIPALNHLARGLGLVQMRLVLCVEVNGLGQ